jgi:hypothetical protein
MRKRFPGPHFPNLLRSYAIFFGGAQRAALLCCLWLGAIACSGCNFLESLLLGPSIDTKTVPNAVARVPYSFKIQASGADLSTWGISATPPGLEFDGGRIKGTPTQGGTFKFEVTLQDYSGEYVKTDSRKYTMLILDIVTTGVPNGVANSSYPPTKFAATGTVGTPAWDLSGGGLPPGMSLSNGGILGGTPTEAGAYGFTVRVTDQDTPPRSQESGFNLLVANPAPAVSFLSPASVVEGGSDFQLTVSGSGFVASSVVQWNGEDRTTLFATPGQLRAVIPAADIASGGSASITVINSRPLGGRSDALVFTVVGATPFTRASVDSAGAQGHGPSLLPAISGDGRFVAFESEADDLVSGDENRFADIFLRDTCAKAAADCRPSTIRASSAIDGGDANGPSAHAAISADGRFVVFESEATNLVADDLNQKKDIFLRDTCQGARTDCRPGTEKISTTATGADADGASHDPAVSGDGRFVAFVSVAGNLVPGGSPIAEHVFVRDTCHGADENCQPGTSVISVESGGMVSLVSHGEPSLSEDGRYVVFVSEFGTVADRRVKVVLVRDTCFAAEPGCQPSTQIVSMNQAGAVADGDSWRPRITRDGRYVVFSSKAGNLATGSGVDGSRARVYLRDTCRGALTVCAPTMRLVSTGLTNSGAEGDSLNPSISRDGRYVIFESSAANLVAGDSNGRSDIFLADLCSSDRWCAPSVTRMSRSSTGEADGESFSPVLSADGQVVAFASGAMNLIGNDSNYTVDVFVIPRTGQVP